jgi:uncharacterized FAD-dependent dehydrogenase
MKHFNVLIIGSGPAGLFSALWLEKMGVDKIAIFDRQAYPAGGLLNDGKLNFDYRIGLDLPELKIDAETAQHLIREVKHVFTKFPPCRQVTFVENREAIEAWERIAQEQNVQFIAPEQWHWGTDNGRKLVNYLRNLLQKTTFLLETEVVSMEKQNDQWTLACKRNGRKKHYTGNVILSAPGRGGAYWFRDIAHKLGISHRFGPIDVGIRVELNRKFYDPLTKIVYDPKFILRTRRHGDRVRTFCTNPGGRVTIENYGAFKLVNGDALSHRKTENTNFALLSTVFLTKPFSDTTEFGQMIARQFHLLGGGKPIVQRVGDFRAGRRSSAETFNSQARHFHCCKATYHAVPGDITLGLPARVVDNLWESMKKLDSIVPGILHPSTLLYAPEIKFFDTQYSTHASLETNIERLFVAGDGAAKSRGIVGAAISGIIAAEGITKKYFSNG